MPSELSSPPREIYLGQFQKKYFNMGHEQWSDKCVMYRLSRLPKYRLYKNEFMPPVLRLFDCTTYCVYVCLCVCVCAFYHYLISVFYDT